MSNTNNFTINISCLGSTYLASKAKNAGSQYQNNKNMYLKEKAQTYTLTISGPSALDIGKLTIKTLTNESITSIKSLITSLPENAQVSININGHSRGGIIANNLLKFLKTFKPPNKKITKLSLSLADAYAGPANRLTKENRIIENDASVVVITLREKRFRSPAISIHNNIIVFTRLSHYKTKYIMKIASFSPIELEKGVYVFNDTTPNELLSFYHTTFNSYLENNDKQNKDDCEKFVKNHFTKVSQSNCQHILTKFGNNISSVARAVYFFSTIAKVNGCKEIVKRELIKNHKSMLIVSQELRKLVGLNLKNIEVLNSNKTTKTK